MKRSSALSFYGSKCSTNPTEDGRCHGVVSHPIRAPFLLVGISVAALPSDAIGSDTQNAYEEASDQQLEYNGLSCGVGRKSFCHFPKTR